MNERLIISLGAVLAAIAFSRLFRKRLTEWDRLLLFTTPIITLGMVIYYYFCVINSSHGMAIIILPFTTGWLSFRKLERGRPNIPAILLIIGQGIYFGGYFLMVFLQEH
jgi:hypothetical protein